eukprot:Gb_41695 [translate_table: standard]
MSHVTRDEPFIDNVVILNVTFHVHTMGKGREGKGGGCRNRAVLLVVKSFNLAVYVIRSPHHVLMDLGEYEAFSDNNKPAKYTRFLKPILLLIFLVAGVGVLCRNSRIEVEREAIAPPAGHGHGVSEKRVSIPAEGRQSPYPWTNAELLWQRTAFHFQPQKNWMNVSTHHRDQWSEKNVEEAKEKLNTEMSHVTRDEPFIDNVVILNVTFHVHTMGKGREGKGGGCRNRAVLLVVKSFNLAVYVIRSPHHVLMDLGEYEAFSDNNKPAKYTRFLKPILLLIFLVAGVGVLCRNSRIEVEREAIAPPAGHGHGVSEKRVSIPAEGRQSPYPWTNAELLWQRTAFHFQPQKNWMNGPMYYRGWYHLFYQYNPESAVWGNITWAHAVSRDLVQWLYLDLAMMPDKWYDINGVWTGSATVLPGGRVIMVYTGSTNESVQVQNVAYPEDPEDPLLQKWIKGEENPVLLPPEGIGSNDFRDPTTAWVGDDGVWRMSIGSKVERTGVALLYRTRDFVSFEPEEGNLHQVSGTGMWECVDFYPIATSGTLGLNTCANASGWDVKHVLKASLDDDKHDYYSIGRYDAVEQSFIPDDPELDVGIGLRLDYGKYYASKTFFDPVKQRRILWGWVGEMDSEQDDIQKQWASLQAVPRSIWFDNKTRANLIQWPVEEVDALRTSSKVSIKDLVLRPGSVIPVNGITGAQLDVEVVFHFPRGDNVNAGWVEDELYNCSSSQGASERGSFGPFGLLVLAEQNLVEQTAIYFYISKAANGHYKTHICNDETRSSLASDLIKRVYGSSVTVLSDERTISFRVLVDHSIVETYAQGGRACITSRVYPTRTLDGAADIFLFNNATTSVTLRSLDAWQMASASMRPYQD